MNKIVSYFNDEILDSYNLAFTFGETNKSLKQWLEEVGISSMVDVTMQTIFDTLDVTPDDVEKLIPEISDVFDNHLRRFVFKDEYAKLSEIIRWHCEQQRN